MSWAGHRLSWPSAGLAVDLAGYGMGWPWSGLALGWAGFAMAGVDMS
jgi:hypothetical protein